MTNGEKLKEIFPYLESDETDLAKVLNIDNLKSWWNAEYKEPTKNEVKYCDRNICLKNEYNNVGCEDCEVTKSQEPTTKNNLGVDCIDRQATLDAIIKRLGIKNESYLLSAERTIYQQIKDMPSVTPPAKKGHWISTETKGVRYAFWCRYKCSLCGGLSDYTNFCPNCGAKMESEDKE